MITREIERDRAPSAWAASRDARQRSLAAQTHYSQAQQVAADRMRMVLDLVYHSRNIYVTYRQRFIAVKVDAPLVRDRKSLLELETQWGDQGYEKIFTNQGVTYRIPKQ
jgi:hypothetical protein